MLSFEKQFIKFSFLILILLGRITMSVSGQSISVDNTIFTHITQEDGLGTGVVSDIIQDHTGFIWVGTYNGLYRYDGQRFKLFQHNPDDSTSLSANKVTALAVGSDNRLWISTEGGGLNCYDPESDFFKSWIVDSRKPDTQPQLRTHALLVDSDDNVWIGTEDEGFCLFDESSGQFNCFESAPGENYPLNTVLWMTESRFDSDNLIVTFGRSLTLFSKSKKEFIWKESSLNALGYKMTPDNAFEDHEGDIWLTTYGHGIFKFEVDQKKWTNFIPGMPGGLEYGVINTVDDNNYVYFKDMTPKSEDEFWIAGHELGLGIFNTLTGEFSFFEHESGNLRSIPPSKSTAIFLDADQRLWVGFEDRLAVLDPYRQIFNHVDLSQEFSGTDAEFFMGSFENLDDKIIAGGRPMNGLLSFDENFSDWDLKPIKDPQGNLISHVWELFKSSENDVYVSQRKTNSSGLFVIDHDSKESGFSTSLPQSNEFFQDKEFRRMVEDHSGNLWVLHYDIYKMDFQKDTIYRFPNFLHEERGANWGRSLFCLFVDSKNQLWVGSDIGSRIYSTDDFTRIHPDNWNEQAQWKHFVYQITEDKNGKIWLATENAGLDIYDPDAEKESSFENMRKVDGLPSDKFYNILTDHNGDIWASSSGGLSKIDPDTYYITNYSTKEGLKRNDLGYLWRSALKQLEGGQICIGDFNGFTWFHPDSIRENKNPPRIAFTGFSVFDTPYIFEKDLNYIDKIDLNYQQNFFRFEFAALNYTEPEKNSYQYKLDGYDSDWRSTKSGEASYTGVPGGNYTFRVKASNSYNVWNEEGRSINLYIRPPFWKTWWFIALVLLASACLLGLLYWNRVRRIKQQESLKTEFNKRIAEVEMTALRAQMNPHFLFNCMNSINLFILKNDTKAASSYLTKFSRLIRLILNNSQARSIPLSHELESLDLYVQMEQLRFRRQFVYETAISSDINAEQTFIPPMIIQPYIENAIWHGLMRQEKEGYLKLSIQKAGSHLHCEIEDNGIGRKASAKKKKSTARKRKSYGMEITKNRMELTNKLYNIQGSVEIVDLVLPDGQPGGTLVKLKIPILNPENYESSDH